MRKNWQDLMQLVGARSCDCLLMELPSCPRLDKAMTARLQKVVNPAAVGEEAFRVTGPGFADLAVHCLRPVEYPFGTNCRWAGHSNNPR